MIGTNLIEFKNPNGGLVHSITFSSEHVDYATPFAGSVAQTGRARALDGYHFNYICRSRNVSYAAYTACIQANFIGVITQQLCR